MISRKQYTNIYGELIRPNYLTTMYYSLDDQLACIFIYFLFICPIRHRRVPRPL